MLKKYKVFLLVLGTLLFAIMMTACGENAKDNNEGQGEDQSEDQNEDQTSENLDEAEDIQQDYSSEDNPIVTITMENNDEINIELYPKVAPNTVNNFISLVENGFYDGVIFHRVIPDFMVQGGDPDGNGMGGPGYGIKGEFSSNGFENDLIHVRGVLSMARSSAPDSAGSQFFLMVADSPHLDGDYAAFGKVTEGMEAVDAIVSTKRDSGNKPLEEQQIKTAVVDTKGNDFPDPEKE